MLQAFEAERTYLLITTKAKKPDPQPPELLKELHRHLSAVDEIREANRASPLFQHLSAVQEGILALGWIVETRPADSIGDYLGGAQYYGNKVLKDYKDKSVFHCTLSKIELMCSGMRAIRSTFKHITRYSGRLLHT